MGGDLAPWLSMLDIVWLMSAPHVLCTGRAHQWVYPQDSSTQERVSMGESLVEGSDAIM